MKSLSGDQSSNKSTLQGLASDASNLHAVKGGSVNKDARYRMQPTITAQVLLKFEK